MSALRFATFVVWGCALLAPLTAAAQPPAADAPETHVLPLNHVRAQDAARVIRELLGDGGQAKMRYRLAFDERTNTLFLTADAADLARVAQVVKALDVPSDAGPPTDPTEYEVRLFWLVAGPTREEPAKLPDDLKDVAAGLTRSGLEKPRLAAQVAVPVTRGSPFEAAGLVQLDAPLRLTVSGMAKEKKDAVSLEVSVNVTQPQAGRDARPTGSLHTQLTVPLGRPTLLGITPTEAQTSAFVIQVQLRQPPSPAAAKPAAPAEKRIIVQFSSAPWAKVFEWLTDQTGLPVVMNFKPTGTFSFAPPKGGQGYTLPEVIDILNEALMQQKCILLRREHSVVVVPADEPIEGVPRVRLDELGLRGKTELVSVVYPLKAAAAEEVAREVKKLLGPFGQVVAVQNQLVMQDTAGNLMRVVGVLIEIEERGKK